MAKPRGKEGAGGGQTATEKKDGTVDTTVKANQPDATKKADPTKPAETTKPVDGKAADTKTGDGKIVDGKATTGTATPETPAPIVPAGPPDKEPFFKRVFGTKLKKKDIPEGPSETLDREKTPDKNALIWQLVDRVASREFEAQMRNKRFKELYGSGGIAELRSYLAGDGHWEARRGENNQIDRFELVGSDFHYDQATGTVRYNLAHSLTRKTFNFLSKIGIKGAITAAIGGGLALMTGGGAAVMYPALAASIIGSSGGRLISEAFRQFTSQERVLKEKEEAATIRYFQHARELAMKAQLYRVGPGIDEMAPDPISGEDITFEEWQLCQTQILKDLVNYVHSYETLSVVPQYDAAGNPTVNVEENLPDQAGLADGTDVHQSSAFSVDHTKMGEIRADYEKEKLKWEKISNLSEMLGGFAAFAVGALTHSFTHTAGTLFAHAKAQYVAGHATGANIDFNILKPETWAGHMIQRGAATDGTSVFHFNSFREAIQAKLAAHTTALPFGEFGSHVLGESAARIDGGIIFEALKNVYVQCGSAMGILFGRYLIANGFSDAYFKFFAKQQESQAQTDEGLRRRLQPDTLMDQLQAMAETQHRHFPEVNDIWRDDQGEVRAHYRILKMHDNGFAEMQLLDVKDEYNPVIQVRVVDMIDPAGPWWFVKPGGPGAAKDAKDAARDPALPTTPKSPEDEAKDKEKLKNPEKKTDKIGKYETSAGRERIEDGKICETFAFEKLKNGDQLILSLSRNDKSKLEPEMMRSAAELLKNKIDAIVDSLSAGTRDDREKELKRVSDEVKAELSLGNDVSWSIVLSTQSGRVSGFRYNNDRSQLLKISSSGKIIKVSSDKSKYEAAKAAGKQNEYIGETFYEQSLDDGDKIILIDRTIELYYQRPKQFPFFSALFAKDVPPEALVTEIIGAVKERWPDDNKTKKGVDQLLYDICVSVSKYSKESPTTPIEPPEDPPVIEPDNTPPAPDQTPPTQPDNTVPPVDTTSPGHVERLTPEQEMAERRKMEVTIDNPDEARFEKKEIILSDGDIFRINLKTPDGKNKSAYAQIRFFDATKTSADLFIIDKSGLVTKIETKEMEIDALKLFLKNAKAFYAAPSLEKLKEKIAAGD